MTRYDSGQRNNDVVGPPQPDGSAYQRFLMSEAEATHRTDRAPTAFVSSNNDGISCLKEGDLGTPLLRSFAATDRPLLAVPYTLSQSHLTEMERVIEKELLLVTSYLSKRIVNLDSFPLVSEKLNRALERLHQLNESLHRIDCALSANISRLKSRLATLYAEPAPSMNGVATEFSFDNYRKRISWVVADYLARQGFLNSARGLAEIECIGDLVDTDLYVECDEILKELHAHKLGAVLRWAESHHESLREIRSNFLEQLKVQQVVMCLQCGDIAAATSQLRSFTKDMLERCAEARKLFSAIVFISGNMRNVVPKSSENMPCKSEQQAASCSSDDQASNEEPDVQTSNLPFVCMYCEKMPNEACEVCSRYRDLISDARWEQLSMEFQRCMSHVYNIGPHSLLENLLRTGFCAIKSTSCGDHRNSTCPACLPEWREYVEKVPISHKLNSPLVCPVTGEVMSYENPPFASPGGYVLSERGIRTLAQTESKGSFATCPKSKRFVPTDAFQKIFIT